MTEQTISRLRNALDDMVQAFEDHVALPEKNCSCHSCPPCNDCVENDFARNALEGARAILRQTETPPPDDSAAAQNVIDGLMAENARLKEAHESTTRDARRFKSICVQADLWANTPSPSYWAKDTSRPVPDHGSGPTHLQAKS